VKKPPDAATRRLIAGGATDDDLRAAKDDPELSKLREAERVLFPRPLPGVSAGWSWDLPSPSPAETEVSANGLPPGPPSHTPLPVAKDADWLRGLALPNLPVRYDGRVLKYLKFYRDSPSGRAVARVWAKKSGRYQAALRASLARAGLPTDLVYLSLIESGHNPGIASPAGAVGLWQFMPDTARTYGLTVDRWVDERLDPERSTEAAVRFLADLYRRFGSWDLAMAGYNMGHGGLARAMKKFNTNDFWELARHEAGIPWETTLYVPKILATAIVMNNKKSFGLDGIEPDPPENFGVIEVGPSRLLSELAASSQRPWSA
jgi:membrane-bound lytic murein transglycosylase D